jgi:uncharacterized protein YnzC (UPF0291/DUF896 family)
MEKEKIDRINALARLAKQRELTAEETAERAQLRKEYLEDWRAGAIAALENVRIQEPDGSIHPLMKKTTD